MEDLLLKYYHDSRDKPGNYFPMPKSIFRLGLISGEILVYAYLMYCEDRKTFQCHPSFSTIGEAVGMSNNTVKKYVRGLEHKGLITTEHTKIKTRNGRVHNGSLLYTLKPIEPIEERYFQKVLAEQASKNAVQNALARYQEKRANMMKGVTANENENL
jgi:DNA-binding Lrp family transcriptional regulator